MSTLPSQPNPSYLWKQEVNRRLAEHRNRKGPASSEPQAHAASRLSAGSRAAEAAARVAARYANAPSYSEVLAGEARAAVRAAEAATWAAHEAQAAAESVLAGLEAVTAAEPDWAEPARSMPVKPMGVMPAPVPERESAPAVEPVRADAAYASAASTAVEPQPQPQPQPLEVRWEPDFPARQAEPEATHEVHGLAIFELEADRWADDWRQPAPVAQDALGGELIEAVEPSPIHANLIEFPREIVAPRRARPRLAEEPIAETREQLSIFEVDPAEISHEMQVETMSEAAAPAWTEPQWPGIELDAQPAQEYAEDFLEEPETSAAAPPLEPAPIGQRLMAAIVNGALISGAFLAAMAVAAANAAELPPLREIEVGAALALLAVGAIYQALFYALANGTPGMMYAHITLCTFDGRSPTRAQRCGRLGAMLLSLLPMGLGLVWAIFDEEHLSWHDRLSKTYLRKY